MITKKDFMDKKEKREAFNREREKLEFRLEQFRRNVKFGYSDANFATMAYDFERFSKHLALADVKKLGELWSSSYVEVPSTDVVDKTIDSILENIF